MRRPTAETIPNVLFVVAVLLLVVYLWACIA